MKKGTYTTPDGVEIYYKDWGTGPVVTFSHGWPLSADAWDAQMLFLGKKGYRVIAHDRRGHGRSGQSWEGNNMDQYADDLAGLMDHLDIKEATMVGHSTGGGEVVRYIARHGQKRVAKVVLIAAVPPLMLKTEANPSGLPLSVFDDTVEPYLRLILGFIGITDVQTVRAEGMNIPALAPSAIPAGERAIETLAI